MSTDLLNYCLEQLVSQPRALNIRVPLSGSVRNGFTRFWSKARFDVQQQSILTLLPDNPLYGKGYLWPYKLAWQEQRDLTYLLRIEFNLNVPTTPRELILLASVSESPIPFINAAGKSIPKMLFSVTKTRLLGREGRRGAGAVAPALRPGIAAVQYLCQSGPATIGSVAFSTMVDIEK